MVPEDVADERVGQRGRVTEAPAGLERLPAQLGLPLRSEPGIAERATCETGEEPDPEWAVLLSDSRDRPLEDGEVVLGVVSAPLIQRRWWASAGAGAWTGRSLLKATQCHVSDVRRLEDASLSYSSLRGWEDRGQGDDFIGLMRRVWRTRAYGDFWSYMLLADGAVDLVAEPDLALHDMAALVVIVEEAGGRFTDLTGTPGPFGGSAVATNGPLHEDVLARIGSS